MNAIEKAIAADVVVVPRNPTDEILDAIAKDRLSGNHARTLSRSVYSAIIAAAEQGKVG